MTTHANAGMGCEPQAIINDSQPVHLVQAQNDPKECIRKRERWTDGQ
jgi:hypothetical protein